MNNSVRRRDFIRRAVAAGTSLIAWPLVSHGQDPKVPVVGYLDYHGPRPTSRLVKAFRAGLADSGFVEGRDLSIEYRSAGGDPGQLPRLVTDLIDRHVDVIVAVAAGTAARWAKSATSTIPLIFAYAGDPVKDGLVASLSRPGSNVTGMTGIGTELAGKRLDLLLKLVPQARKVGFLVGDSSLVGSDEQTSSMREAGRAFGVEIMIEECRDDRDYESALARMVEGGADAMIRGTFPLPNPSKLVQLALLHKLPAIYPERVYAQDGGLASYDTDYVAMYRRIGSAYVAGILRGMKPADLPVEQPTKFELVLNLSAAKAIGLEVPAKLLAVADEVIGNEPPRVEYDPSRVEYDPSRAWNSVPTITVVCAEGDPRVPLVREAVAFWNDTFAELGTPFRLGPLTQVVGAIPVGDLTTLSANRVSLPESLKRIRGNIVVALSNDDFISFTARPPRLNKVVVAIKDHRAFPLTLPNVARNVIAHELGHAIGLSHNADPVTLMCGRPAPCRPTLFASNHPKYFPLTETEMADLQRMYPRSWQASPA